MRRLSGLPLLALALVAALSLLLWPVTAGADGTTDAWTDGNDVGAGAGSTDSTAGGGSTGAGATAPVCEWVKLASEESLIADRLAESGDGPERGQEPGAWYRHTCVGSTGSTSTIVWVTDRVDPLVLARRAADRAAIPSPALAFNPSPSEGAVVNVETWLWVERSAWRAVSAQAASGGVTVTATAAPQRVVWEMGNGDRVTCNGPGPPYDRSKRPDEQTTDCSYTYRSSSARAAGGAFTVTATVSWAVTWSVTGAAGGGSLGTVSRSQSIRMPVREIQAVNR